MLQDKVKRMSCRILAPSPAGRGDRRCALCDKHLELNLATMGFEVYLEDVSSYKERLRRCGFLLEQTAIVTAEGVFQGHREKSSGEHSLSLWGRNYESPQLSPVT